MAGLVPAIHAAPIPAGQKRSVCLTTSPNALAFGLDDRDKPAHDGSAVVILALFLLRRRRVPRDELHGAATLHPDAVEQQIRGALLALDGDLEPSPAGDDG